MLKKAISAFSAMILLALASGRASHENAPDISGASLTLTVFADGTDDPPSEISKRP